MMRIGIAGLGFMGRIHLKNYLSDPRAKVVAIADPNPDCLNAEDLRGKLTGDIARSFDVSALTHHLDFADLLRDDSIDAISICSPTATHVRLTLEALGAGKHVLVEKPLGLTHEDAHRVVVEAARHPDLVAMPAMCMRFWPAWAWLREVILENRFGRVLSATFTRIGSMPTWSTFYRDSEQSGSAILDLHIHDADFVRFCFGDPEAVQSIGYSEVTDGIDHVVTHYRLENGPPIVIAEGGWTMKPGFDFTMRYLVNFEKATATFNLRSDPQLRIDSDEAGVEAPSLSGADGWREEVRCFLDCIEQATAPGIVTMHDGAEAVRLVAAERESVATGKPVRFKQ